MKPEETLFHTDGTSDTVDPQVITEHPKESVDTTGPSGVTCALSEVPKIPGYTVVREIARGGMGRILLAHDLTLCRDVAIKLLLPGANGDRFVRESRITACLPHPGIPPVHSLGRLDDGAPFMAMKFVAGHTLAAKMKSTDLPQLLQTFSQVCHAVGFAHSKGIIHRDLKPSNVMVGDFGEVHVMDWGLAKELHVKEPATEPIDKSNVSHAVVETSECELTQIGDVMGTPAYMAPEQARGESVDARVDVFALGAILCEILTGKPPFVGRTIHELIICTSSADMTEAHARLNGCAADPRLVSLCRACISAKATDRPADGLVLARALTAYLAEVEQQHHRAELAKAEAKGTAAGASKRRYLKLALVGAGLLLLLGGATGTGFYLLEARKAQVRVALNTEQIAGILDQAKHALNAGNAANAKVLLETAEKQSAEGGAEKLHDLMQRLQADLAVLNDLNNVDQFSWGLVEDRSPSPEKVAGRLQDALARFGVVRDGGPVLDAAKQVTESAVRDRVVSALDRWLMLEEHKSIKAAVRAMLQAVDDNSYRDAFRDAVASKDKPRLVELAAQPEGELQPTWFVAHIGQHPAVPFEVRRPLLLSALQQRHGDFGLLLALGNSYPIHDRAGLHERIRWYAAAVEVAPTNTSALHGLGFCMLELGDLGEAEHCFRKIVRLVPDNSTAYHNLGVSLAFQGNLDAAIAEYKRAIRLRSESSENAGTYRWLGEALQAKGDADGAIRAFEEAIRLKPSTAIFYTKLGDAWRDKSEYNRAIAAYKQAVRLEPRKIESIRTCYLILQCFSQQKDVSGALDTFQELARDYPDSLAVVHHHGDALNYHGNNYLAAAQAYKDAIGLDPNYHWAHKNLGDALRSMGKREEAVSSYKEAIRVGAEFPEARYALAGLLLEMNDVIGSETAARTAVALFPKDPKLRTVLGEVLAVKNDIKEAVSEYREARRLDPMNAYVLLRLGQLLSVSGDLDEAIELLKESVDSDAGNLEFRKCYESAVRAKADRDGKRHPLE